MMNRIHKKHRLLKALLSIFLVLLLIVAGYAAYVFIAYNRLPDNLTLDVSGNASDSVQTETEYSVLSFNIGDSQLFRILTCTLTQPSDERASDA